MSPGSQAEETHNQEVTTYADALTRHRRRAAIFQGFFFAGLVIAVLVVRRDPRSHLAQSIAVAYCVILILVYFPWRLYQATKLEALRKREQPPRA